MNWTLTELADLAAQALADAQVGVASGRVTGTPDARMVRWYTTIGLLDRPDLGPGRVARYGPRHLWQLVAVKRLQAQGLPLAEIQHRLVGATDETLRQVAALPVDPTVSTTRPVPGPTLSRPTAGPPLERPYHPPMTAGESMPSRRERFWAGRPSNADEAGLGPNARVRTAAEHRLFGLQLGGLTLLLPVEPEPDDWEAIATAARPLLDVLADRGLLDPTEGA